MKYLVIECIFKCGVEKKFVIPSENPASLSNEIMLSLVKTTLTTVDRNGKGVFIDFSETVFFSLSYEDEENKEH